VEKPIKFETGDILRIRSEESDAKAVYGFTDDLLFATIDFNQVILDVEDNTVLVYLGLNFKGIKSPEYHPLKHHQSFLEDYFKNNPEHKEHCRWVMKSHFIKVGSIQTHKAADINYRQLADIQILV
jgi:hypothetical protein